MNAQKEKKKYRRRLSAWQSAALKVNSLLKRTIDFVGLKGMTLTADSIDPEFLQPHGKYENKIIQGPDLREHIDAEIFLHDSYIEEQILNGSFMIAYFDGDRLISYGWYLDKPHEVNDQIRYHFDPEFLHMFNGFTRKEYRGQNVHAYGMGQALKLAEERGFKGLVSEVGITNFASLKSCDRLGYRVFGHAFSFKLFGRRFCVRSRGCRAHKYRLEPIQTR